MKTSAENPQGCDPMLASSEKYQALFAEMGDGFALHEMTTGPEGAPADLVIIEANAVFEGFFGAGREEFLGRPMSGFLPPGELQRWLTLFAPVSRGGPPLRFENHSRRTGRQYRGFACSLRPGLFVVVLEDVTDRRRTEQERRELESQLIQAQKMEAVGQLAGGIAHDFNNILAAIIMHLNMLRLQPNISPNALSRAFEDMLESANRAAGLTKQLLLLGRGQPMKMVRHDVNDILRELKKLLTHMIEERVVLAMELSEDPLWFDGDAGMIEQVVMNLTVNARDAMPNGGRLTIATRLETLGAESSRRLGSARPGPYICLKISDTGCGIDAAILENVFDPFFTTKPQGKGTGLGLATVRGIAAKHGGFVEVQSRVGTGSTFSIYLPSASAPRSEVARRARVEVRGGSERVLVVEDEDPVRRMTVQCLRSLGYRVTEAANGVQALAVWEAEEGRFDLLFTDMVMPEGLSGLDLCSSLRKRKAGLKTVIASGYSTEFVHNGDLPEPDFVFLPKPYDIVSLAEAVRRCLEKDQRPQAPGGAAAAPKEDTE